MFKNIVLLFIIIILLIFYLYYKNEQFYIIPTLPILQNLNDQDLIYLTDQNLFNIQILDNNNSYDIFTDTISGISKECFFTSCSNYLDYSSKPPKTKKRNKLNFIKLELDTEYKNKYVNVTRKGTGFNANFVIPTLDDKNTITDTSINKKFKIKYYNTDKNEWRYFNPYYAANFDINRNDPEDINYLQAQSENEKINYSVTGNNYIFLYCRFVLTDQSNNSLTGYIETNFRDGWNNFGYVKCNTIPITNNCTDRNLTITTNINNKITFKLIPLDISSNSLFRNLVNTIPTQPVNNSQLSNIPITTLYNPVDKYVFSVIDSNTNKKRYLKLIPKRVITWTDNIGNILNFHRSTSISPEEFNQGIENYGVITLNDDKAFVFNTDLLTFTQLGIFVYNIDLTLTNEGNKLSLTNNYDDATIFKLSVNKDNSSLYDIYTSNTNSKIYTSYYQQYQAKHYNSYTSISKWIKSRFLYFFDKPTNDNLIGTVNLKYEPSTGYLRLNNKNNIFQDIVAYYDPLLSFDILNGTLDTNFKNKYVFSIEPWIEPTTTTSPPTTTTSPPTTTTSPPTTTTQPITSTSPITSISSITSTSPITSQYIPTYPQITYKFPVNTKTYILPTLGNQCNPIGTIVDQSMCNNSTNCIYADNYCYELNNTLIDYINKINVTCIVTRNNDGSYNLNFKSTILNKLYIIKKIEFIIKNKQNPEDSILNATLINLDLTKPNNKNNIYVIDTNGNMFIKLKLFADYNDTLYDFIEIKLTDINDKKITLTETSNTNTIFNKSTIKTSNNLLLIPYDNSIANKTKDLDKQINDTIIKTIM